MMKREEKTSPLRKRSFLHACFLLSQTWLPTVQDVLHADWQDAWHSPQPPVLSVFCIVGLLTVLMCFFS